MKNKSNIAITILSVLLIVSLLIPTIYFHCNFKMGKMESGYSKILDIESSSMSKFGYGYEYEIKFCTYNHTQDVKLYNNIKIILINAGGESITLNCDEITVDANSSFTQNIIYSSDIKYSIVQIGFEGIDGISDIASRSIHNLDEVVLSRIAKSFFIILLILFTGIWVWGLYLFYKWNKGTYLILSFIPAFIIAFLSYYFNWINYVSIIIAYVAIILPAVQSQKSND